MVQSLGQSINAMIQVKVALRRPGRRRGGDVRRCSDWFWQESRRLEDIARFLLFLLFLKLLLLLVEPLNGRCSQGTSQNRVLLWLLLLRSHVHHGAAVRPELFWLLLWQGLFLNQWQRQERIILMKFHAGDFGNCDNLARDLHFGGHRDRLLQSLGGRGLLLLLRLFQVALLLLPFSHGLLVRELLHSCQALIVLLGEGIDGIPSSSNGLGHVGKANLLAGIFQPLLEEILTLIPEVQVVSRERALGSFEAHGVQ
mmetsp:Transcript_3832/g.8126  ORF Transcript_3832/g.8126 Transcript_3832/m.8126 type:complete len:255 (-) Transcript_3832:30-794(-)